jgi:outer membrane autotransporter protein
MKKLLLLSICIAALHAAQAQVWVSGSYIYRNLSNSSSPFLNDIQGFEIGPRIGYQSGNWLFGADVQLGKYTITGNSDDETRISNVTAGPFVRYIHRPNQYLGLWLESSARYSQFRYRYENSTLFNGGIDQNTFELAFRPGVLFFIGQHIAAEFSIGLISAAFGQIESDPGNKTDTFILSSGLNGQFALGVNYIFSR